MLFKINMTYESDIAYSLSSKEGLGSQILYINQGKHSRGTGNITPNNKRRVKYSIHSAILGFLGGSSLATGIQIFRYDYGYLYDLLGKGGADALGVGLILASIPLLYSFYHFLKKAIKQ